MSPSLLIAVFIALIYPHCSRAVQSLYSTHWVLSTVTTISTGINVGNINTNTTDGTNTNKNVDDTDITGITDITDSTYIAITINSLHSVCLNIYNDNLSHVPQPCTDRMQRPQPAAVLHPLLQWLQYIGSGWRRCGSLTWHSNPYLSRSYFHSDS